MQPCGWKPWLEGRKYITIIVLPDPVDMKQIRILAIQQNAIVASLALILRIATSSYKQLNYSDIRRLLVLRLNSPSAQ
jgi:hypothetical protein